MKRVPRQCAALTKANKRCSITTDSKLIVDSGRLAAEPLVRGGRFCAIHAQIFNTAHVYMPSDARIFYLDFETSGLNVLNEHIVEIGLLDERSGSVFSTVVCPPSLPGEGPTVHGIPSHELAEGPHFAEAFARLLRFVQYVVEMAVVENSDSSASESDEVSKLNEKPPAIVIAAHNGFKFDLPILFVEMLRNDIGLEVCEDWYFVDTLHVFRAADDQLTGGCVKLQCLLTRCQSCDGELQAHRALDCWNELYSKRIPST